MDTFKYLFFIATHKRHDILKMCLNNLMELREKFPIEVFCVGSEGDEVVLDEYDLKYIITDNNPLGRKKNIGLLRAMEEDFTHLIELGSDDIITEELLTEYASHLHKPYFGVRTYHMIDLRKQKAKFWEYGFNGEAIQAPIGAGRVFSKEALEDVLSVDTLWPDAQMKVLDGASDNTMMRSGYRCAIVPFEGVGIIDIKSDENIWPFDEIEGVEYEYEALEGFIKDMTDDFGEA